MGIFFHTGSPIERPRAKAAINRDSHGYNKFEPGFQLSDASVAGGEPTGPIDIFGREIDSIDEALSP
jgi:hypothetical protein